MSRKIKRLILYATAFIYALMGVLHLVIPNEFLFIMPDWMPYQAELIFISGIVEILLAILLIPKQTRRMACWLIIAMLVVYLFLIHIPQSIAFSRTNNKNFIISLLRIPLQFMFIYLIWPSKKKQPDSHVL